MSLSWIRFHFWFLYCLINKRIVILWDFRQTENAQKIRKICNEFIKSAAISFNSHIFVHSSIYKYIQDTCHMPYYFVTFRKNKHLQNSRHDSLSKMLDMKKKIQSKTIITGKYKPVPTLLKMSKWLKITYKVRTVNRKISKWEHGLSLHVKKIFEPRSHFSKLICRYLFLAF